MNESQISIIVSLVVLISAILSPIIVALINNKHQQNLALMEINQQNLLRKQQREEEEHYKKVVLERQLLLDFLSAGSRVEKVRSDQNLDEYNRLLPHILVKLDDESLRRDLLNYDMTVQRGYYEDFDTEFHEIILKFKDILSNLQK